MTTARAVALAVLDSDHPGARFVGERLDVALRHSALAPVDRGFATELVYGVLRRRATLDALLAPFLSRRPTTTVYNLLRLGTYQLALLGSPAYAVIDTAVNLAARPPDRGFVNAVLRQVARMLTEEAAPAPAADALPLADGSYRRLARPVFADPATDASIYVRDAFALPEWLVERWRMRWGVDECVRLGQYFAAPGPLWLRVNRLRTTREQLLEALPGAEAGPDPHSIRHLDHAPVTSLPGYEAGHFSVQDLSSQRVAAMLNPQPGWTVLDRCAAPGGKSTHIAELMGDRGRVVACDVDEGRLTTVRLLAKRLGLTSIETVRLDRDQAAPAGPYDAAVVDVPCSNTGVLHRRPEARWRIGPRDLAELVPLQTRLLLDAAARVKLGGVVVYSTCSIEPEENVGVVRAALKARPGLSLDQETESPPGQPADGGYRARLRVTALR
jgi:16S rRNA (cytosine967-C5)-methyltransferase